MAMSEHEFEFRLDRMFSEPPAFSDNEAFARRVEAKLERGWSMRSWLIGAAGVAGGLIGVSQMVGAGVLLRGAGEEATRQAAAVEKAFAALSKAGPSLGGLPVSGEVMWMTAALGVMALGFAITRATQEF